ncbi:hypothetical protein CC78DRAFT_579446 [Lojkania enalia]|uniref:Autophagy-related protein 29 n=1 Tax=Lojkania enalia TaxID=147567 RepID=A0A9P4KCL6_9PLEO|nr:hypothetical protein CC78DRAFT_579446 [Didymosphaeria enalia]
MAAMQFTVIIRLPFARGNFVDPPQADWNAAKDRALWKVISKSSKTSDLDWVELASRFQVPPTFLLQQAAWLYERHLDHVRTQMKRVGNANASAASAISSSQTAVGGIPMRRLGSGGSAHSRTPSALSVRLRDSPLPRGENIPAPSLSRTPSTNTITQSKAYSHQAPVRTQFSHPVRTMIHSSVPPDQARQACPLASNQHESGVEDSPGAVESSSSLSSSEEESPIHRSQLFKRPPRFRQQRPQALLSYDEGLEDGEDVEPSTNAFLPFASVKPGNVPNTSIHPILAEKARQSNSSSARHTLETSRGKERVISKPPTDKGIDASSSIASSASDIPKPSPLGPFSPHHRSDVIKNSPHRAGLKPKREGSEGTPSMGSSFSDLDDASITQSALEEALLSNIQHGRMSTLSQLRSRYL